MDGKTKPRETLDVPSVAPLERRLANMTRERPAIGPAPRSSVLDKLASFLPQLAQENAKLKQQMQDRPATDFDIETVEDDGEAPYIEMDLTCGILELRDQAALRAAERAMEGFEGPGGMAAICSSSDDDDDDDEEAESNDDDSDDSSDSGSDNDALDGVGEDGGMHEGMARGQLRKEDPPQAGEVGGLADAGGAVDEEEGDEDDEMECEEAGREGMVARALAAGRVGRGRRRGGAGVTGARNGGAVGSGRRKVAVKRSKFIEELS